MRCVPRGSACPSAHLLLLLVGLAAAGSFHTACLGRVQGGPDQDGGAGLDVFTPDAPAGLDVEWGVDVPPGDGVGSDFGPLFDRLPPDGVCSVQGPPVLNPGWIGGACSATTDCAFDGAVCLGEEDGYPDGSCSQPCDRLCPDREGDAYTVTFCVEGQGPLAGGGMCVSRCDFSKRATGCREGYVCANLPRFNEPATLAAVCVPEGSAPPMPAPMGCYAAASQACLAYTVAENPHATPAGVEGVYCDIVDPMRLQSPVNGVRFVNGNGDEVSMLVGCDFALAINRMVEILKESDVVEVVHYGTYNCRAIAGTNRLSQHGLGNAIDLAAFRTRDGTTYSVLNDWEGALSREAENCSFNYTPMGKKAKWLLDLAERLCRDRVFNVILTPNYNDAHNNHFHVDLTDNSQFLGIRARPPILRSGVDD